MKRFDLIGFDADDTLWHNESLYAEAIEQFKGILAGYASEKAIQERLDSTEMRNLKYYGYGITGFTLSLIETAIGATNGQIPSLELLKLTELSRTMIDAEVRLLERVEDALVAIASDYPLLLITKGDLLHQRSKLDRSGLGRLFQAVEVVSNKDAQTYAAVLERQGVEASRFLMVGNSLRSDILPVLALGGSAVYIPYEMTWVHEMAQTEDLPQDRFFELEHMGQLEELLERLELQES